MVELAPGIRVKCVCKNRWIDHFSNQESSGPKYGSVWTVLDVGIKWGIPAICLEERPLNILGGKEWFAESEFIPLDGDKTMEQLVAICKNPGWIGAPREYLCGVCYYG